jgi:hypothetical protein
MPTGPASGRPDDRLRIEPQMCNRTSGNLEIPGSRCARPGMTASYRPVFTRVQSRLMIRWVAGSRAVMTKSFFSVASSG